MFRNLRQYCLGDGLCVHRRITMHAFADALQKGVATPERTVFRQSPTFVIKPAKQDWLVISEQHRFMRGKAVAQRVQRGNEREIDLVPIAPAEAPRKVVDPFLR